MMVKNRIERMMLWIIGITRKRESRHDSDTFDSDQHLGARQSSDDNHSASRQESCLAKIFRPHCGHRSIVFRPDKKGIQFHDVTKIRAGSTQTFLQLPE